MTVVIVRDSGLAGGITGYCSPERIARAVTWSLFFHKGAEGIGKHFIRLPRALFGFDP